MASPHPTELLEMLLRECLAAGHHPWYVTEFIQETGLAREPIEASLDQLRMAGLVALTPWVQGRGQGYQLTPYGRHVVEQPRLLARVRSGDIPLAPNEPVAVPVERHALEGLRGEAVRDALLNDSRPYVTHGLIAANIVWFFVGMVVSITRYKGTAGDYLAGGGGASNLAYIDIGSLFSPEVIDYQQWWRLLSSGFVHGGALHLFMNMYALYVLGPLLERMWGRAAFLAVYLGSLLGGSAAALLFTPQHNVLGASGAICGLLGSMASWVFLNRHYLPPHIVRAWRQNIVMNVVLITVISFLPNVSLAGHAGGGIAGAVISFPLCMARFDTGQRRWLGWAGAAAMVIVGLCLLYGPVMKRGELPEVKALRLMNEARRHLDSQDNPGEKQAVPRHKKLDAVVKTEPVVNPLLKADEIAFVLRNRALGQVFQGAALTKDPVRAAKLAQDFQKDKILLEKQIAALQKMDAAAKPNLAAAIKSGLAYFNPAAAFAGKMANVCAAGGQMTIAERTDLQSELGALGTLADDFKAALDKIDQ